MHIQKVLIRGIEFTHDQECGFEISMVAPKCQEFLLQQHQRDERITSSHSWFVEHRTA